MAAHRLGHESRTKTAIGTESNRNCKYSKNLKDDDLKSLFAFLHMVVSNFRRSSNMDKYRFNLDDCCYRETAAKAIRGISRMARTRANRRNTMDCALLNEIFIDDDSKKACDKRSMQLLRESERDLKRSSGIIYPTASSPTSTNTSPNKMTSGKSLLSAHKAQVSFDDRADSFPALRNCISNNLSAVPKLVESSNRYMSVASRQVGCRSSAPAQAFMQIDLGSTTAPISKMLKHKTSNISLSEKSMLQTRQEFHETFANLIKLGSSDKQDGKLSSEDYTWQTELKDMIWLELQAWHADRSLEQQDKYLYSGK